MDTTLRQALRRTRELRNQIENLLLGDEGDIIEAELKKFVAKRPCWVVKETKVVGAVTKVTTLADMITAGKYDWVNSDITEANFPMPSLLVLGSDPKLYHFDRDISSKNAIKEMAKDGYRPATIWDLLDYGAKNPELQRQFPIVALGSVCEVRGFRVVTYLGRNDSKRNLSLYWIGYDWGRVFRFLAVRN